VWVLVLIFFNGPMEISRVDLLEYHWNKESCSKRVIEADNIGLPPDTNIGCIQIKHISKA